MVNRKNELYMDRLLKNKDFKEKFEREYQDLIASEKKVKKGSFPFSKCKES